MGRGAAMGGGQHGSGEKKKKKKAAKLPPLVEVKKELSPSLAAGCCLEVLITRPEPEMLGFNAWPAFCVLEVYVGGTHLALKMLPIEKGNAALEEEEIEAWELPLSIPVGLDWPSLSLDLNVLRLDYFPWQGDGGRVQLIRGGPHTSSCSAVIGMAHLNLADALLVRDEVDQEGKDGKKRRRDAMGKGYADPRMKSTPLEFNGTLALDDWEMMSALMAVTDGAVAAPCLGTVDVHMTMFRA